MMDDRGAIHFRETLPKGTEFGGLIAAAIAILILGVCILAKGNAMGQ